MNAFRQRLLYALVLINILPHFWHLPLWICAMAVIFVCWRWLGDLIRIAVPGRIVAATLAIAGSVSIFFEFGHLIGEEASPALLILMVSLKVFEIRAYRDVIFVTFLCFLLLMSLLLVESSFWVTGFLFLDVTLILSLMHYYHLPEDSKRLPFGQAIRLLFLAAPLLITLFLLFPRFNLGWFARPQQTVAQTGFSGRLDPGSVAQLVRSQENAFRAFLRRGEHPPINRFYWRGAVLSESRGLVWEESPEPITWMEPRHRGDSEVEILLDPHGRKWLFTPDWSSNILNQPEMRGLEIFEAEGRTFRAKTNIAIRERYVVLYSNSHLGTPWSRYQDFSRYLKVDPPSDRVRQLVKNWQREKSSSQAILARIRDYFVENEFVYTLNPPGTSSIDQFLFESKMGFCEHFASTTATLLRYLEIPSRVVVGYQGGSMSLLGDYIIVAQKDAHAWVEYWSGEQETWVRVDPTFWVAPRRIDQGAIRFFAELEALDSPGGEGFAAVSFLGEDFLWWISRSKLMLDQAEVSWVTFLLRYDFNYQREWLAKFGLAEISRWRLALLNLIAFVIVGALGFRLRQMSLGQKLDSLSRLHLALVTRLKASGLEVSPQDGPLKVIARAKEHWPQAAREIELIFSSLLDWRYGGGKFTHKDVSRLRQRIRRLNLKAS